MKEPLTKKVTEYYQLSELDIKEAIALLMISKYGVSCTDKEITVNGNEMTAYAEVSKWKVEEVKPQS